jgi:hypothetical protein
MTHRKTPSAKPQSKGKSVPNSSLLVNAETGPQPVSPALDSVQTDPMREVWWSIPMALAWIMWGEPEDVRRHWKAWREDGVGEPLAPTNLFFLENDDLIQTDAGNPPRVRFAVARSELLRALQEGAITVSGISEESGKRAEVPLLMLADLVLEDDNGDDVLNCYVNLSARRAFSAIRLPRKFVQARWPRPKKSAALKSRANAERECQRWLEDEMRKSPDQRLQTFSAFMSDAMGRFNGLSQRAFRRAWDNAIVQASASAWQKAGAPRKS